MNIPEPGKGGLLGKFGELVPFALDLLFLPAAWIQNQWTWSRSASHM